MNYFTFGQKTMRITQNYNGSTSHRLHWYNSKDFADYPIDIAGIDNARDAYYAMVDMKVVAIKGKGNAVTNTIWLVATEKCNTPSGVMLPFIMLTHWNDNDPYISKLSVGSIVRAGDIICLEGTDGATNNHLHLVCGDASRGLGNDFIQNSNDKWVSTGYCMKPELVMYVDRNFTSVRNMNGIVFYDKPEEIPFFDANGYFGDRDNHENIGRIADFMYKNFPAYTDKRALGNYYGPYIKASIKEFQRRASLEGNYDDAIDGYVGPKTLEALKKYGFEQ